MQRCRLLERVRQESRMRVGRACERISSQRAPPGAVGGAFALEWMICDSTFRKLRPSRGKLVSILIVVALGVNVRQGHGLTPFECWRVCLCTGIYSWCWLKSVMCGLLDAVSSFGFISVCLPASCPLSIAYLSLMWQIIHNNKTNKKCRPRH